MPAGSPASRPDAIGRTLETLFERFVARNGNGPRQYLERPWEADWESACVRGGVEADGQVRWQPARQQPPADFSDLEAALEVPLHPDIRAFFGTWWSDHVPVTYEGVPCDLLFVWNRADLEMLQANLIGHALEKRRIGEPLTVFFAAVDDFRFLSVDNTTGAVVLETLGRRGPEPVLDTLACFLDKVECADYRPSHSTDDGQK